MSEDLMEYRVRNQLSDAQMLEMEGKMLNPDDYSILITGPARVLLPDGRPLCVYRPKAIPESLKELSLPTLNRLRNTLTSNRGAASGTERVQGASKRSYARGVASSIIGSFDPAGAKRYCRLTAFTAQHREEWEGLQPLFQEIAANLERDVPERFANQMREARKTSPDWVIPGTPFTTVTVNHTYPTGVHRDKGDLDSGFSTLAVFRRGEYQGGQLCFPQYRIAVDMQDRDLLLMEAHAWHGNCQFVPEPKRLPGGQLDGDPGFERVSIVSYFRTRMVGCGSAADENEKARIWAETKMSALVGE